MPGSALPIGLCSIDRPAVALYPFMPDWSCTPEYVTPMAVSKV